MLIYADKIIVASSFVEAISVLLKDISSHFALKDLGDLYFFLGTEVKKWYLMVFLYLRKKYVADLLAKVGMT
jgi:histone deacetylase 1/2